MRHLITLLGVLILSSSYLVAQPDGDPICYGPDGTTVIPCSPGAPVPITGIEVLIGAGALLGAKRMMANRKSNT